MRNRLYWALATTICLAATRPVLAQRDTARTPPDTNITHMLRLRDGSTLLGKMVFRDSASVRFETNGGVLTIPAANVVEVRDIKATEMHGKEYWFRDPNRTRLFFAPTARMLEKGEGYYSNTYLFLQNFVGGLSDKVTFGGGFSVLPSDDFLTNNVYYLTPKLGLLDSPKTSAAVGLLAGFVPTDGGHTFGILYGVATKGGPDASATGGVGYGYTDGTLSRKPLFMLGGSTRVARRVALVTENYGAWYDDEDFVCSNGSCVSSKHLRLHAIASYGIRFMGEKLSTDFAFWNYSGDWIFPGIPYLSFAVKF